MSKEGHFLAGTGTSGYFEDLKKREIKQPKKKKGEKFTKPIGITGEPGDMSSVWFPGLERSSVWRFTMKNSSRVGLKAPLWPTAILAGLIKIIRPSLLNLNLL